jgi:hypothetical protein
MARSPTSDPGERVGQVVVDALDDGCAGVTGQNLRAVARGTPEVAVGDSSTAIVKPVDNDLPDPLTGV